MTRSTPHPWRGDHVPGSPTVVVGVMPGQRSSVVRVAADLARRMQTDLVCVWADAGRVFVAEDPDGTLHTAPLDPDAVDDGEQVAEEHELARDLAATLDGAGSPGGSSTPSVRPRTPCGTSRGTSTRS